MTPEPLSREILIAQGKCCGNGCTYCPYIPKGESGATLIQNIQKKKTKMTKANTKNHNPEVAQSAQKLDEIVNLSALHLFKDKTFRNYIDYQHQSQIDRDRIFNELVVSFLILMIFALEDVMKTSTPKVQQKLVSTKDQLPTAHVSYLAQLGVEEEFQQQWYTLIEMRLEECETDKERVRREAITLHSKEKELSTQEHLNIQSTLPIHTVAINLHHHILKGKIDQPQSDALFLLLFKYISESYVDDQIIIKYGKVSLWQKVWRKAMVKWNTLMGNS